MASALPIVAAAAGGPLDILTDNVNGLLFQADSQEDFIDSVGSLLSDTQLAARLGRQGRKDVEDRDWETVMDGLLDDYARIARQKRPFPLSPSYLNKLFSPSKPS